MCSKTVFSSLETSMFFFPFLYSYRGEKDRRLSVCNVLENFKVFKFSESYGILCNNGNVICMVSYSSIKQHLGVLKNTIATYLKIAYNLK